MIPIILVALATWMWFCLVVHERTPLCAFLAPVVILIALMLETIRFTTRWLYEFLSDMVEWVYEWESKE